jgi:hypothetical protein
VVTLLSVCVNLILITHTMNTWIFVLKIGCDNFPDCPIFIAIEQISQLFTNDLFIGYALSNHQDFRERIFVLSIIAGYLNTIEFLSWYSKDTNLEIISFFCLAIHRFVTFLPTIAAKRRISAWCLIMSISVVIRTMWLFGWSNCNLSLFKFWHLSHLIILLFLLQSSSEIKFSLFHILTRRAPFVPHPVIIEYVACIYPSKIQILHPLIVIPILEVASFLLAPPEP